MTESAPTALYHQHHDVEAPRVDARALTRLDGLLADKAITTAVPNAEDRVNDRHRIRAVLGASASTLLETALVRDLSRAALGRHYRCDPKTGRAWVIAAIKAPRTI
jgi:hypothetical protein